ncbi:MAG: rhomboid family intramembrane serine protease [Vulcanimicrobiaceae bacterium]
MIPIGEERRSTFFAAATYAIVAINLYVFFREIAAPDPERFIDAYALTPWNFTHGIQLPSPSPHPVWLTLLTAMFLHGSFWHIFFNMLFLIVFGPAMERYLGHLKFIATYLLCGIVGGLTQVVVSPNSHVPEIGASGAIAGILGAYIVTFPTNTINTVTPIGCFPLFLRLPAVIVIGVWAVLQFVNGFGTIAPNADSGGTAYFAHIGGFACGAILVGILGGRNRRHAARRWR